MTRRRCLLLGAVLFLGLVAACGGPSGKDSHAALVTPTIAKESQLPTKTMKALGTEAIEALKQLAHGEDDYIKDHDQYLEFQGTVPSVLGGQKSTDFVFGALTRGRTSFCSVAVLKGSSESIFFDSAAGGFKEQRQAANDCQHLGTSVTRLAKKVVGPSVAPASPGDIAPADSARAALRADLRNLAIAEETYLTDNDSYLAFDRIVPAGLVKEGFRAQKPGFVYSALARGKDVSYCLVAFDPTTKAHAALDSVNLSVNLDDATLAADCKALLAKIAG